MLAALRSVRHPVEISLLVTLAFFLPLLEAPKGLAWLGYTAAWLVNRARARDYGGPWDAWDTLIVLWIGSGFAAAAFAGLQGDEWHSTIDLVRYGSILWLLKRGRYADRELAWVLGALMTSTLLGLAIGYARLWSGIGKSGTLQLHSVGHVNHTAIYLAIMLGVAAAWVFARWHAWANGARAIGLAVAALLLASLVVTASRGAIGIGLLMLLVLAAAWWPRWRVPLIASTAAVALLSAVLLVAGAEVVRKHMANVGQDNVMAYRDIAWRTGLAAWERFPLFGVGMNNYGRIDAAKVKVWREEAGKPFDPARYGAFAHAHSVFINTLAERGAVGLGALAAVAIAWLAALVRRRPHPRDDDLAWLLWAGAAAAWLVTFGVGTVNTTLHSEHGILATLLLGLWLSRTGPPRAS